MKILRSEDNLCCDDALRCIFDLNKLDINVYKKLKEIGEARADEIAVLIDKERSTVYRSLQKLASCGICTKNTRKITRGGYFHTYNCIETKIAKKRLKTCLDNWYKSMNKLIEILDKD